MLKVSNYTYRSSLLGYPSDGMLQVSYKPMVVLVLMQAAAMKSKKSSITSTMVLMDRLQVKRVKYIMLPSYSIIFFFKLCSEVPWTYILIPTVVFNTSQNTAPRQIPATATSPQMETIHSGLECLPGCSLPVS